MENITSVTYDSFDLNDFAPVTQVTERLVHDSFPARELSVLKVARRDGEKLVAAFFAKKEIEISGYIIGTSITDAEQKADAFKAAMQGQAKNLDIEYASGTRRYIATVSELRIEREPEHLDWMPYTARLIVPNGKGEDISPTVATYPTITATSNSLSFSNGGSALAEPRVGVTINSHTGLTGIRITVGGYTVEADTTLLPTNFLTFDWSNYTVKKNGVTLIDFSGAWGEWQPGTNAFTLVFVSASAINASLAIVYTKKYL